MSKGRILVVEDDLDISTMLRIYFEAQGYEARVALSGKQALETCRRELPNLVILDIMLPGLSGYEIGKVIRAVDKAVPIIF